MTDLHKAVAEEIVRSFQYVERRDADLPKTAEEIVAEILRREYGKDSLSPLEAGQMLSIGDLEGKLARAKASLARCEQTLLEAGRDVPRSGSEPASEPGPGDKYYGYHRAWGIATEQSGYDKAAWIKLQPAMEREFKLLRAEAVAALEWFEAQLENKMLVRGTGRDGESDWALRMVHFGQGLQSALAALVRLKGAGADDK